jgi:type II secretory pathway predicted ATPase ExeA
MGAEATASSDFELGDGDPSIDAVPAADTGEVRQASSSLIYGEFFGLSQSPFDLTPNSKFLFLTPRLREALSNLRYGLATSKGLTVLIGDAGTGKTTLIRAAAAELDNPHSRYVLISNPTLNHSEFYEMLAAEFGFSQRAASSKAAFLAELQADVKKRFAKGGLTGLIVDEAQSMPHALLEEIRLLGNIETMSSKLLNIVLCGQPELAQRLNEPELRQLKQRVALRCELKPLTLEEALAYVSGRIRIAGGSPAEIFTAQAVKTIHAAARGIPRSINVLCDNALISGLAAQVKPITMDLVNEVCRDFDLRAAESEPAAGAARPGPSEAQLPQAAAAHPVVKTEGRELFQSMQPRPRPRFLFFG